MTSTNPKKGDDREEESKGHGGQIVKHCAENFVDGDLDLMIVTGLSFLIRGGEIRPFYVSRTLRRVGYARRLSMVKMRFQLCSTKEITAVLTMTSIVLRHEVDSINCCAQRDC